MMDPRKCDWCGTEFVPKNGRRRFCSVSCQVQNEDYQKSQYVERRRYIACAKCGKKFYTITTTRTICLNCERAAKGLPPKSSEFKTPKVKRITYAEIVAKNRANPIQSGSRGQVRIAARPALMKFD